MDYEKLLKDRKARGIGILKSSKLTFLGNFEWSVPSQSSQSSYTVKYDKHRNIVTCNCPDFASRRIKCKHICAVEYMLTKEIERKRNLNIAQPKRITYSQDWVAYDQAQTNQKALFMELLNDLCMTIPQTNNGIGRPKLPLSEMVFASTLKVYTTFTLRRFITDINRAKEKGFISKIPHYSTVALYMESEDLTPIIKRMIKISALPLRLIETDFTVDASGFSTSRFDRWFNFKFGKKTKKRVWIKAHLMSGTKSNIVTSVEVTPSFEADTKFLKPLLSETVENFQVKELSADMGYSSSDNLQFITEQNATPYIPFKLNVKARVYTPQIWRKMFSFFLFKQEEFLQHYHKRSKAETVFHMIKSKFGDSVRSKTPTAQINEVLLKVLCHNICVVIQEMFELGIKPNFCVEKG
ncbi:MAG: transposase [Candidatus Aenigmarchaeota archaeon]|nr:transposase [Candidatus Aenigmarchaeota archaeon]